MKTQKLISGLLFTILFYFSFGLVNALSFSIKLKSIIKAPAQLKYVFVNEVDSTNKDILKLYDDFTYEFLFFQKTKNIPKVKREKGTYSLKKDKLVLDKETEAEVKEHLYHFLFIENKGLANFQRFNKPKKETEILYVLNNDAKYWQPIYHDPYFGDITNDKKASKKIIDKKLEYVPVRVLSDIGDNSKLTLHTNSVEDDIEPIKSSNGFISLDSLRKLKAIIIVGPVEESTKEFIDEQKATAKYLRSVGVRVFEFYHPNAKWEDIVKASQDANILIYSGHGRVSVFCITDKTVEGDEIQRDLKLHKNAIVIFNHACESAGSSAIDRKDIGQAEAFRRVGDYAKTFVSNNASVYYANNYNDCLISFFSAFFSRKTVKSIYIKEATKWTKIEATKKYIYDSKLEIIVASKNDTEATHTVKTYQNGKLKKVEELKGHKKYDIAFVGKPTYTVLDLFK